MFIFYVILNTYHNKHDRSFNGIFLLGAFFRVSPLKNNTFGQKTLPGIHCDILVSIYLSVSTKLSQKSIQPINFIFGGSIPSDPGKKWLDSEKHLPW